jgi:hypothetical protein
MESPLARVAVRLRQHFHTPEAAEGEGRRAPSPSRPAGLFYRFPLPFTFIPARSAASTKEPLFTFAA